MLKHLIKVIKRTFFKGIYCRFLENAYICTCVFHSIRFKVNKGLGHGGDPFFFSFS